MQIGSVSTGDAKRQAPDGQNYALNEAKEVNILLLKVPFHDRFFSSNLRLRFFLFLTHENASEANMGPKL